MVLRPEQRLAVDDAINFLRTAVAGDHLLFSSPTGTGKSFVMNAVKAEAKSVLGMTGYVVSPNDDILAGFASKAGITDTGKALESHGYFTPIRLRNQLAAGAVKRPDFLLPDEAHHWDTNTSDLVDLLCSGAPAIGFTATPYRGTPNGTLKFRKTWGEPRQIISMREAVKQGYMTFPTCRIVPLLDDDVIEIKNGEFVVASLNQQLGSVVDRVVFECSRFRSNGRYDKPTLLSFPSVDLARMYTAELNKNDLPAVCVTGDSSSTERRQAFQQSLDCTHLLVQIRVVSEGVDFPFRRLVDLSPTLSPVLWLQQFGRITRPGDDVAEYICTNRNLLRHAYLLEGLLPAEVYASGEKLFGKPSERQTYRALGFEGLGKFKSEPIPLKNGTTGQLICISAAVGSEVTEYAAIASPLHSDVLYAKRVNIRKPDGTKYDEWQRIDSIPNLEVGFQSIQKGSLTDPQNKWWKNRAHYYGLDNEAKINRRQFASLPILRQTGFRFR